MVVLSAVNLLTAAFHFGLQFGSALVYSSRRITDSLSITR